MTTMLERAARAVGEVAATMSDDVRHVLSERAINDITRAVLMAVREPDDAVAEVGLDAIDPFTPSCLTRLDEAQDFWGAMIDAILNEEQPK